MARADQIVKTIKTLASTTPDIEASAVIDTDGLIIASALPQDIDEDAVAAMSAALLGIGERIARELARGDFEMVMVRGGDGILLLTRAGPEAVLAVLCGKNAKLGLILLDVKRAAAEVGKVLS